MKTGTAGASSGSRDVGMRTIHGCFCVMLSAFALVQYNDPDAILWFLIYAIPAIWAGVAAIRPERLEPRPRIVAAYAACLAAALGASLCLWPSLPAGWIRIETEREGLGVIIATIVLIVVGIARWSHPERPPALAR